MTKPYIRDNKPEPLQKYNPSWYMYAQLIILWEVAKLNNPNLPWNAFESFLVRTTHEDLDYMTVKAEFQKMLGQNQIS